MRNLNNYGFGTKPFIMAIDVGDPGNPSGFFRLCATGNEKEYRKNGKSRADLGRNHEPTIASPLLVNAILRNIEVEENDDGQIKRVNFANLKSTRR